MAEPGEAVDASPLEHLVVNTGRSWSATRPLCRAISSSKLGFALVEHGAELWDVRNDLSLDLTRLAADSGVGGAARALKSTAEIPSLLKWFQLHGAAALAKRLNLGEVFVTEGDKSWNLTFRIPSAIDGNLVVQHLKELIDAQSYLREFQFVYQYSSWNQFVDVMGLMDKGIGLTLAMAHLGLGQTARRRLVMG